MIQQEIWVDKIKEVLFPSNEYYTKAINDSAFITNRFVHAPVAGGLNPATRNRAALPAAIGRRTDVDNVYRINAFTTDPITVEGTIEAIEASYDKFASISNHMAKELQFAVGNWTSFEWANDVNVVPTSGAVRLAYHPDQAGNRNTFVFADIMNASQVMNLQNIPMEGRKMLIDGYLYMDLLTMPEFLGSDSITTGILSDGAIGRVAGFDVYLRTPGLHYSDALAKLDPTEAVVATSNLGALCWHPEFVRVAVGTAEMFYQENAPEYYGSIVSAGLRAGGIAAYPTTFDGVVSIVETV